MGRGTNSISSSQTAVGRRRRRTLLIARRPLLFALRDDPRFALQRRVALDVDSILYPLLDAMAVLPGGEKVSMRDCKTWEMLVDQCGGVPEMLKLFNQAMQYEHMRRFSPYPGVAEGLKAWREHGITIDIMTSREPSLAEGTARWLADFEIEYESFTCDLETDKVEHCRQLGIETIVDDHPQTLANAHAAGLEALSLAWPFNGEVARARGLRRAGNWNDLAGDALDAVQSRVLRQQYVLASKTAPSTV